VLVVGDNPIKAGLAASLNRPGGTVTGVTFLTGELMGKRIGLLRQLLPHGTRIAYLEQRFFELESARNEVLTAASALGWEVIVLSAASEPAFDPMPAAPPVTTTTFPAMRPDI
jgi:putative ABC transport system substrate-binding protein